MKYHYQIRCPGILDETVVTFTAPSLEAADVIATEHTEQLRKGLPTATMTLLAKGAMSAAALMGAKGGTKSKRKITKTQQAAMQKARKAKALR